MLASYIIHIIIICNHPFLTRLDTKGERLFNLATEITNDDRNTYLIYDQTHKVLNANSFDFIG